MSLLSMLILAYSTILQFSMPSIVLCFGEDGHIAFEQSDGNHPCGDVDDYFTLPVNNCTDLSGQKDDCQDVSLLNILSALYMQKDGKIKIVKPAVVDIKIKTIKTCLVYQSDINKDSTIIPSSMKSLQATILII